MAVKGIRLDATTRTALFGATKMLKDRGQGEVARFALQRLQPSQQSAPAIVVVGEVKRGKSSLVNALIGHPGLSPVGVDVTTNSFVRFVPPTREFPADTARIILPGERRQIPLDEVPDWSTVGGRHVGQAGAAQNDMSPIVRGVEVAVNSLHLPNLELIDTPGVGGLTSAHAQVASHTAAWASLLLFVSDAGQPFTSNELNFLAQLSETVDGVVLALTKKDLYPAGWREILAENRTLLRRYAPRFADVEICVVSSQLATRALTVDNAATRGALLVASGIPALAEVLTERAGNAEYTSVANALRTVRTGLDQVSAQLEVRKQAAAGGAELLAELTHERARLDKLQSQSSRWNLDLDRDIGGIRSEALTMAGREFAQIRDRWTHIIAKDKHAMRAAGRREMMAGISFELEAAAARVANQFYRSLYEVVSRLFDHAASANAVFAHASPDLGRLHPPARPLRPSGVSKLDPSLATTAFFGVSMAKGMFGVAAGASMFSPFILPLAAGWLGINFTYRVVKGGRTQLQAWMQESVQAIQGELVAVTDNVIRDFRPEIVIGFREFLASAGAELRLTIKEAEAAAAAGKKERSLRVAALDRHLQAVAAQRLDVDKALAALGAGGATAAQLQLTGGAENVLPRTVPEPGTFVPPAASNVQQTSEQAAPTGAS